MTSVAPGKSAVRKLHRTPEGTKSRDERGAMVTPAMTARLRAEVTRVVVTAVESHLTHAPAGAARRAAEAVEVGAESAIAELRCLVAD